MTVELSSVFIPIATVSALVISVIVLYFKHSFNYWKKKDVEILAPSIPGGNIGNSLIGKQSLGEIGLNIYNYFKSKGLKHGGFYFITSPVYVPMDPDVIKDILIKDFQYFMDRGVHYDEVNEPLSAHLFALAGPKWRHLRGKLSPTFTSGKMKMMFQTMVDCSDGLNTVCDTLVDMPDGIDIKDVLARFTTDVIGSCAFGLECNSLKDPDAEFRKMGRKIFELNTWEAAKTFIGFGYPALAKLMRIKLFNQEMSHFFLNSVKQTVHYRETNDVKRKDFLQLLLQLKNKGHVEDDGFDKPNGSTITLNEAAAHAFVFFAAGFETSSTTMNFCLFEISRNTSIQDTMRKEVEQILKEHDGKLTYEAINEMKYMDKVIQETLRKYPPILFLNRTCNIDYKIRGHDLTLDKGTSVFIPVYGIHKDSEYFPDPEKFDPERFNEENKSKRHSSVYLPFGDGPRNCIGMRFGLMQTKVGLAVLLRKYKFTLNSRTKLPLKFNPKALVLTVDGDIWMNIKKVK